VLMFEVQHMVCRLLFSYDFDENKILSSSGKFLSEALLFASINPQYDNRLFMELP
jgi:hypothetical protein